MMFTVSAWTVVAAVLAFWILCWQTARISRQRDDHAWRITVLEDRAGIVRPPLPRRRERWRIAAAEWAAIIRRAFTRRPAQGRHRHPEDTTDADQH